MRFWDPADPEITAANSAPWDGPLASAMRPLPLRALPMIGYAATILCFQAVVSVGVLWAVERDEVAHLAVFPVSAVFVILAGIAAPIFLAVASPRAIRRWGPLSLVVGILGMGVVTTVGAWGLGPRFGFVVVIYLEALPFAFYALRLRWALLVAANAVLGCGLVMALQDGWPTPPATWLVVASTVVATAWILGVIAERAERLAASEHEMRLRLDELNHTLEERVADQVTEIERLGGLRRFLSPQVADAVLSGDPDAVTRPHRQRIAVFFCDLRGFTAFTRESEPEEVIADLDQYYRTVGEVLQRHGATIGGYAGDGIMAYFGDPVPHPEPARAAVQMVTELRGGLGALVAEWQRRGHDLSYGVGIAYGYATLGVVGFDGRYDYTPMGGVVNLAARLCDKATAAQVLVDHATYADLDGVAVCAPVEGLELKGLGAQRAYALT